VLRAAARLAPAGIVVHVSGAVGTLPLFNLDTELAAPPPAVVAFRHELAASDAVLVCSPEYAHGVPGAFKNGLDWLVGVGLHQRPVGIIDASSGSTHAFAALREILVTMDGDVRSAATIVLPPWRRTGDVEKILADVPVAQAIRACVMALAAP
jgi:NAD(P)H-dependent FMN reductase